MNDCHLKGISVSEADIFIGPKFRIYSFEMFLLTEQ